MAAKKQKESEANNSNAEEREEYIRSMEISVQFIKNELDRVNAALKEKQNSPPNSSPIEKHTSQLLLCNDVIELINKTHQLLSKYFSVVECNFYFKNEDGDFQPVSHTDTCAFLNKQTEHLAEQGILDWIFEEHQLKTIPNLESLVSKQSSYIIFPIFQKKEHFGVFIASTTMHHNSFEADTLESLSNILSVISMAAMNLMLLQEKNEIQRKFDIINDQLMQNSLLHSVGEIAGTISREIENPILIINANADLILRGIGNTSRRAEIIVQNMQRLEYLNSIIKNIAFENDSEQSSVSMKELIAETLDILEFQISNEDIRVETAFADDDLCVLAYKSQLQHVLLNLFLNARDAMPNGGTLSIGCFKLGDKRLTLTIADNGIGIHENDVPNIFEPHYSNKIDSKRLALNLYMTKRIINGHRGKITFVSEHGKGSTFKIILPIISK